MSESRDSSISESSIGDYKNEDMNTNSIDDLEGIVVSNLFLVHYSDIKAMSYFSAVLCH